MSQKAVVLLSGGLDSTHALIVAAKAMDRLGRPRSDVLAFTMPGFATGDTSKSLATRRHRTLRHGNPRVWMLRHGPSPSRKLRHGPP